MAFRRAQRLLIGLSLSVFLASTVTALSATATATYAPLATGLLFGRDGCLSDMFQCDSSLSPVFSNICCEFGQTCALDADNEPACCPSGAVCTGTAPGSMATNRPTAPVSYVPNQYFSFPFAATSFENSGECNSAVGACSANYEACTSGLRGQAGFAVTIDVPGGGGTTVGGQGTYAEASATSICSSLSTEACGSLQTTSCDDFESDSARLRAYISSSLWCAMGLSVSLITLLL